MMDDLKIVRVTGSAFLVVASVFLEKMTWKKARVTGSAFLAGALVCWGRMISKNSFACLWIKSNARLGLSPERLRHAISGLKKSRQIGQTLARLAPPDWRPAGARLGVPPERESPPD